MTNLEQYEQVFIKAFSLDKVPEGLKRGGVLAWDSVGHMSLISEIEEAFDIMLDTEDIIGFTSYEGGKEILKKYGMEI